MTSPAARSTASTTKVSLNVVLTVVMAIFSMCVASTIRSCGPPCQAGECPAYCQPIWNLRQHSETSVIKDSPTLTAEDEEVSPKTKKRKNPLSKLFRRRQRSKPGNVKNEYPYSSSKPPTKLSKSHAAIASHLKDILETSVPNFSARATAVAWGGPGGSTWFNEGLLRSYLQIMKWPTPETWSVKFPFKLCGTNGCPPEAALAHSLEWREKYRPWCMSPAGIKENRKGFVYQRGHGPNNGHSLVWLRVPIHRTEDPIQWVRAIMNSLERGVADSLKRTSGKIGRFNCVMDGEGFSLSQLFGMGHIKRMVTMLQDHFPDRLGIILFANFAKPAQIMVGLVKPLITKEVRDKLYLLPDDPQKRKAMTDALIGDEFVPYYLGGQDETRFDPAEYYANRKHHCTNAESTEYLKTMPYHAV